jgi:glycosyltransferase involved in cell wall biosynthesis
VLGLIARHGLGEVVEAPGFVAGARVDEALARALCLVLPSRREGYGLVVVEAAAHGTPSIVVAGDDNAAVELIEPGANGVVSPSASSTDLAEAILRVSEGGAALRESTAAWFHRSREGLSLSRSLDTVTAAYRSRLT